MTESSPTPVPATDAELIRMADTVVANHYEAMQLEQLSSRVVHYEHTPEVRARLRVLIEARHEFRAALGAARATTLEGFRAKARALLVQYAPEGDATAPKPDNDDYLAWSLCRDLAGSLAPPPDEARPRA